MESFSEFPYLSFLNKSGNVRSIAPCVEEASDRKFWRVEFQNDQTFILCKDPAGISNECDFVKISAILKEYNIPASQILMTDFSQNLLLLSDVGKEDLSQQKGGEGFDDLFEKSITLILELQKIPSRPPIAGRCLDFEKFTFEMEYLCKAIEKFQEKFGIGSLPSQTDKNNLIKAAFDAGSAKMAVVCHRDYHSRNIMVNNRNIFLIDYQDARMGSKFYDLASLLYDSYNPISKNKREESLEIFLSKLGDTSYPCYLEFYSQALERTLKALGTYLYQYTVLGKEKYRQSIPVCLEYILEILPETILASALSPFIENFAKSIESIKSEKT